MELWVRTQDKERLMIVDNVEVRKVLSVQQRKATSPNYISSSGMETYFVETREYELCCKTHKLGKYINQSRALEVLDEIQDSLLLNNRENMEANRYHELPTIIVYKMPQS